MTDEREDALPDPYALSATLRTFMQLPPIQRGAVILKDVLDYPVQEICEIVGATLASVKSALQRGRARLRELASEPPEAQSTLDEAARIRLEAYVERFNALDVAAVQAMLAEDVRLDLVNRLQLRGKAEVGNYFNRYAAAPDWRFASGLVEGRLAILAYAREGRGTPAFFILLEWENGKVSSIRDFLFARYVMDGADVRSI